MNTPTMRRFLRIFSLRRFLWLVFVCGIGALLVLGGAFLYLAQTLPSLDQINSRRVVQSTKIYDRTGQVLLYEVSGGERRTVIPFAEIPEHLKNAIIVAEDETFYQNPAFDWRGIVRAAWVNLRRGEIRQGGSTITQQLARNAFLTTERTFTRKIRELLLAIKLNQYYTKDQILWLYVNEIPLGSTFYGFEAAAQGYFNKPAKELSVNEAAILASLIKAPTYYSPWGTHTKELFARRTTILSRMVSLGLITKEVETAALAENISFQPQGIGIKAPHFVLMVQDYLVNRYGEDVVRSGGLSVITTLDWPLQEVAERVVAEGAARNKELYDGTNAALVAQDPSTGQIIALVGSRDYFDTKNEGNFNVAAQGLRQPGSALKPFVYLTALAAGYRPETRVFDAPTEFVPNHPNCPPVPDFSKDTPRPCFHPENFDHVFRGPTTLRNALAQSINIPAVKMLYLVGLENTLSTLSRFGITTLTDPSRYGLSLVLGGGEVRLVELVGAYATLAHDGVFHKPKIVLEVKDANQRTLEVYEDEAHEAFPAQPTREITNILADTDARAGLFGGSLSQTVFPSYSVALKTGTSNDYRDAWTIGYTPSLAAGVWAGNNNNQPMHKKGSSILAALPIWSAFIKEALVLRPNQSFAAPEPQNPQSPVLGGSLLDANNQPHNILFFIDKKDPAGPPPQNPGADPQFFNWETGVQEWLKQNSSSLSFGDFGFATNTPTSSSRIIFTLKSPQGEIPTTGDVVVWVDVSSPEQLGRISIYYNGAPVYHQTNNLVAPYSVIHSFRPATRLPVNILEIEAVTTSGHAERVGYSL